MRVAVFVSGGGSNLQAILDRQAAGGLKAAEICLVLASREGTKAEERARQAGIDFTVVSKRDYADQEAYDQALIDRLEDFNLELIVLAGFLSKLGPRFISRYQGRIINVHPSLLPDFGGAGYYGVKPHEAVLEAGLSETGATVHLVTEQYDEGPILRQQRVAVHPDDTAEELQARVMREAEHLILPQVIEEITKGIIDCQKILSASIEASSIEG